MYTIRQAAARSGISVPLLRAWERRYDIVAPQRTAAGYRLYDEAALERLRLMRRLVDAGWTPSTAAAAILSGEHPLADAAPMPDRAGGSVPEDEAPARSGDDLVEAFVAAAAAFDPDRLEAVLDSMFARGTFETVAHELLLPGLVAVGTAWASGRLTVAAEHAASHAALRRLAAAFQAAGRPPSGQGAIVIGMPPSARHELGALAFGTAARRAGLPVVYLGPDLPIPDWVAAAIETSARAAVIGTVTESDVAPAVAVAEALRAALPDLLVCFGGRAAPKAAELTGIAGRGGRPLALPGKLDAAVDTLVDVLAGRDPRQAPGADLAAR